MKNLFIILLLSFLIACSNEEKTINPIDTNQKIIISTENPPNLKIISIPDNKIIDENILPVEVSSMLTSPITFIKEFGDYLYCSAQKDYKLIILDKKTYQLHKIINFENENAEVGMFAFPNSTDCYLIHPNKNYVSVIDITVFKVVKQVTVGNNPSSISISGNQIYVTNLSDNTVSIIDSRTQREEFKLNTWQKPLLSIVIPGGKYVGVISAGLGKIDNNPNKTEAKITIINIENRTEEKVLDIGEGLISPIDQLPIGVSYTINDWLYIATNSTLFRIDGRSLNAVKFIFRKNLLFMINDDVSQKLILLNDNSGKQEILLANNRTGSITNVIKINYKIAYIYPWR